MEILENKTKTFTGSNCRVGKIISLKSIEEDNLLAENVLKKEDLEKILWSFTNYLKVNTNNWKNQLMKLQNASSNLGENYFYPERVLRADNP